MAIYIITQGFLGPLEVTQGYGSTVAPPVAISPFIPPKNKHSERKKDEGEGDDGWVIKNRKRVRQAAKKAQRQKDLDIAIAFLLMEDEL